MIGTYVLRSFGLALLSAVSVACVIRTESDGVSSAPTAGATTSGPTAGGGSSQPTPASVSPMLAVVETGNTMNATPGYGMGVFVEYMAGGHWHVWWTCATLKGSGPCTYRVTGSLPYGGAITNMVAAGFESRDAVTDGDGASKDGFVATTTTTTGEAGLRFDTPPGTVIQLDGTVWGEHYSELFFFVQDGKVRGGYVGELTNPLMFKGDTP